MVVASKSCDCDLTKAEFLENRRSMLVLSDFKKIMDDNSIIQKKISYAYSFLEGLHRHSLLFAF